MALMVDPITAQLHWEEIQSPPPQGWLVADRHLYLDKSGTKLLEQGDPGCASLLCSRGGAMDPDVVDGLGLVSHGTESHAWVAWFRIMANVVAQDYPAKVAQLQAALDVAAAALADINAQCAAYRAAHAQRDAHLTIKPVGDLGDGTETQRVQAEAAFARASARLARVVQAQGGRSW